MSDLKTIKKNLENYQELMIAAIKQFPWDNKEAYAEWLANTYHYAFNSTRIIALGAGTMPPHLTKISNRFIQHVAEEKGHEVLLQNDVKALDIDIKNLPVTTAMEMYYRSLYFWVSPSGNPVGLFGWILSLEALAANVGGYILAEVQKHHPPKSSSFSVKVVFPASGCELIAKLRRRSTAARGAGCGCPRARGSGSAPRRSR